MSYTNQYGLKQHIPEAIKLAVRRECGFGCAFCGKAVIEYHHFDPPFVDAREHRPEGIILLCPTCHSMYGHLPATNMREVRLSPKCRKVGFTRDNFLCSLSKVPKVQLGRIIAMSGQILRHGNNVLLGLRPPEEKDGPFRLTCELFDKDNSLLLRIRNNEIVIGVDRFDVRLNARELSILRKKKEIVLKMISNGFDEVCITHLETTIAGGTISCDPKRGLTAKAPSGGSVRVSGSVIGDVGVWVTDDGECLLGASLSGPAGGAQVWQ